MMDKVTAVFPVFNPNADLIRAVGSVAASPEVYEAIMICDDSGTDSHFQTYCGGVRDRVEYTLNKSRLGPVLNFYECLDRIKTRYFRWVAQDDFVAPIDFEKIRNSASGICYGIPVTFRAGSAVKGASRYFVNAEPASGRNGLLQAIYDSHYCEMFYGVYDLKLIQPVSHFREILRYPIPITGHDYAWIFFVLGRSSICRVDQIMYFYNRTNWENISFKKNVFEETVFGVNFSVDQVALFRSQSQGFILFLSYLTGMRNIEKRSLDKDHLQCLTLLFTRYLVSPLLEMSCKMEAASSWEFWKSESVGHTLEFVAKEIDRNYALQGRMSGYLEEFFKNCSGSPALLAVLHSKSSAFFSNIWIPGSSFLVDKLAANLNLLVHSKVKWFIK